MYNTLSSYLLKTFNEKVYKISLDGGMSCPNRDSNKENGCIFCSKGGSGDFAIKYNGNIKNQIDDAIKVVENKGALKYIAYFQSYTNTYAPIEYLRKLFYDAINDKRIVALSIATRPDSISEECYELLSELNKIKKVFVELGLQTSNDNTATFINRGYESKIYRDCAKRLRSLGINVVTHVIIGLPNETESDLINTVNYINDYTDGVKFTLLHVLKDTVLYNLYKENKYVPLEKDEYIKLLATLIEHLNPNIVVHRVTGDGPKKILVAPLYSGNKKDMLNSINKYIKDNSIIQGSKYNND